jgi:hypothetical protein
MPGMRRILHYAKNTILWAAAIAGGWLLLSRLWFAGVVGLVFIAYLISLVLHPRTRCWDCGGSGRHQAALFRYADRACTTCGGQSRHRRWGVRVIGAGRQVRAERAAARARQRPHRPQ